MVVSELLDLPAANAVGPAVADVGDPGPFVAQDKAVAVVPRPRNSGFDVPIALIPAFASWNACRRAPAGPS